MSIKFMGHRNRKNMERQKFSIDVGVEKKGRIRSVYMDLQEAAVDVTPKDLIEKYGMIKVTKRTPISSELTDVEFGNIELMDTLNTAINNGEQKKVLDEELKSKQEKFNAESKKKKEKKEEKKEVKGGENE